MRIASLTAADELAIRSWPGYPGRFAVFDYALGAHGWLADFPEVPGNHRFSAWENGELIGFSILTETGPLEAEFYIAIRADQTRHGHGRELTQAVLETGFGRLRLHRIHLKVRAWHAAAIHLYASLGFTRTGEEDITINGQVDRFVLMEMPRPRMAGE